MATSSNAAGAREEVLRRIRAALGGTVSIEEAVLAEWTSIDRSYNRVGTLEREAVLEMLEDRLRDYDAAVVRAKAGELSREIERLIAARGIRRLVVPQGLEEAIGERLPGGFDFVVDHGLTAVELDGIAGVVTSATVAIAETGTLVLQNVAGQGRRAPTLVPDYHLCLIHARDVVQNVPESIARLQDTASLATTFVSGPSATADIEMTRIKGVHGPRFLDVILFE